MVLNLGKTWEMVVRGKIKKQLPNPVPSFERKTSVKLLGMTFNKNPCNWNEQFDTLLHKGDKDSSRLYILRV